MRGVLFFVAAGLALSGPVVSCAASVSDVLKRAEDAERHVSYRGMKQATIAYGSGVATSVFKVVHLRPDKTRTEYYTPDPLAGIIVIQRGDDFWRYYPKDGVWEATPFFGLPSVDTVARDALKNYEIKIVGSGKVAGRPTYVIHAMPRRAGESARRIWVDSDHYLVMQTQVENVAGAVLSRSKFTTIEINPNDISPSAFQVSGKTRKRPEAAGIQFKVAKPAYLPSGYKLVGVSTLSVNGQGVAHLQFSNGVNTISLFQRKGAGNLPLSVVKSHLTNMVRWAKGGTAFTLVGSLSQTELRRIAASTK